MNIKDDLPFCEPSDRNKEAILGILQKELLKAKTVLEIGSGFGQHAVFLSKAMPYLSWQPSDLAPNLSTINAYRKHYKSANCLEAIEVDVLNCNLSDRSFDAIYTANTFHIMPITAVSSTIALAAQTLNSGGRLLVYGPFKHNGQYTSVSNKEFDAYLNHQNPIMGLRDLSELKIIAEQHNLSFDKLYNLPANNQILCFLKQ